MQVTQLYEFLSTVYGQVTGKTGIVNEDLSNIVDVGKELLSSQYRDPYVNAMLNLVGKWEFVDRAYEGQAPDIMRKSFEWGSIMSKSRTKDFEAKENPTWSLTPGQTVNQFEYNPPEVKTTLFNEMITWEIDCSFVNRQLAQSMRSAEQLDKFLGMIRTQINNTQIDETDAMVMRCYNNLTGHRIARNKAIVDVLASYNAVSGQSPITAAQAPHNAGFLHHLAYTILLYKNRMRKKVANFADLDEGYTTFTPLEYNHVVLLDVFSEALTINMEADTFNKELVKIGRYDKISNWQGTGEGAAYALDDISKIDVQVSGLDSENIVSRSGIIGVMHDRDALGIINEDRRVEAAYNAKGEYWNNFFKIDTRLFNDPGENYIVFTCGTPETPGNETTSTRTTKKTA